MEPLPADGIRVVVTPKDKKAAGRERVLQHLKAAGVHVNKEEAGKIHGIISATKLHGLAAVPDIDVQVDEEFQISPIETKVT
jgi:hypothetical protein